MKRHCKAKINSLELTISYHCNLTCKGCSHCSPLFKEQFFEIDKELKYLKIISQCVDIDIVKLIGGEPLLNKNIDHIINVLKQQKIAKKIFVATNGLFLPKMSDFFWENIDGLEISIYNQSMENYIVEMVKNKFNFKNKVAYIYCYDKFRYPFVKNKITDKNLVSHIYRNCLFSNDWQCFNYHDGYFFKCPQSWVLSYLFKNFSYDSVGVKVEDNKIFKKKLINYILSEEPLISCSYCLGCVGKLFDVQQDDKIRYEKHIAEEYSDYIDYDFLNKIDNNRDILIDTIYKIVEIREGDIIANDV